MNWQRSVSTTALVVLIVAAHALPAHARCERRNPHAHSVFFAATLIESCTHVVILARSRAVRRCRTADVSLQLRSSRAVVRDADTFMTLPRCWTAGSLAGHGGQQRAAVAASTGS